MNRQHQRLKPHMCLCILSMDKACVNHACNEMLVMIKLYDCQLYISYNSGKQESYAQHAYIHAYSKRQYTCIHNIHQPGLKHVHKEEQVTATTAPNQLACY